MRVALAVVLGVVLGLLGCGEKRHIREWRPDDHDQPEDQGQVEGGSAGDAQGEQGEPGEPTEPTEPETPRGQAVVAEDEGELSTETLWRQQCMRCHGRDGSGHTSMAERIPVADLRESQLTAAQIVQVVTKGRREMPSFREELDADQIRALAQKVLSLRGER